MSVFSQVQCVANYIFSVFTVSQTNVIQLSFKSIIWNLRERKQVCQWPQSVTDLIPNPSIHPSRSHPPTPCLHPSLLVGYPPCALSSPPYPSSLPLHDQPRVSLQHQYPGWLGGGGQAPGTGHRGQPTFVFDRLCFENRWLTGLDGYSSYPMGGGRPGTP